MAPSSIPEGGGSIGTGPGALTVRAALADGYVRRAEVSSTRPVSLSRLFIGRPADEAPVLAGSLFSLCGFSHAVAAALAVARARGQTADPDPGAWVRGILAERVAEYLRSLVIGWSDNPGATPMTPDLLMALRDALAAARELTALPLGLALRRAKSGDDTTQAVSRLVWAARRLGDADDPETALGAMLERAKAEAAFMLRAPDALTAEDDDAVIGRLRQDGPVFAAQPSLRGRVVETGAFARHYSCLPPSASSGPQSAIAARLTARLADLAQAVDALDNGQRIGLWSAEGFEGEGFCAVESPRGRLYHWVGLDEAGSIARYAIVAPTEWNFHPNGPFIGSLLGAKVGEGAAAERRVSWLAALFDPCVAFRVVLQQDQDEQERAGHA